MIIYYGYVNHVVAFRVRETFQGQKEMLQDFKKIR